MSSENVEPEAHPSREVVTREDLSDFRNFLLQQIKLHISEPLLKFDKDTERTVTVSKQRAQICLSREQPWSFRVSWECGQGDRKPSNWNKASQLLGRDAQLGRKWNWKIQIADSSEGGWLTV